MSVTAQKVVVLGGGISGLASAYRIREELRTRGTTADILVLEKKHSPGGHARTDLVDGFVCEWGPNGFLDNEPRTLELIESIGLADALRRSNDIARRRFIYKDGALHLMPESPKAFLGTRLLSPLAKARVLTEPLRPPRRDTSDESVGDFGRRRLGKPFTTTFLDPMVSGIFAGDVDRLSLPAAFPRMVELEQTYGSLFKAMARLSRKRKRALRDGDDTSAGPGGPGGVLHTFEGGMETLIRALSAELGELIQTGTETVSIKPRDDGGFELFTRLLGKDGSVVGEMEAVQANALVMAVPAYAAMPLVRSWAPAAAASLEEIAIAPISVVCLGYERQQVAHPIDGFGVLFPRSERVRTLGVIFSSALFPGQAPKDRVFLRAMIGGARDDGVAELSSEATTRAVRDDVEPILGIRGEPSFVRIYQHRLGIPQYNVGHLAKVAAVDAEEKRFRGLFLTGNSLRGVSLNNCVKDAFRVGKHVTAALEDR